MDMDIILTVLIVLIVLTIFAFVYETYKMKKADKIPEKFEYRLAFTLAIISLLLWLIYFHP